MSFIKKAPLPLSEQAPGPAVQTQIQMVFAATKVPQQFPNQIISPGQSVVLYTVNGSTVNANPSSVAKYPEALWTSSARLCPAGADVSIPMTVNSLGEIWAAGTEGDGLLAVISQASVG